MARMPVKKRVYYSSEDFRRLWSFMDVLKTFTSVEASVQFAEERGLIPREKICSYHEEPMNLESDGQWGIFHCRKSNCRNEGVCRTKGTWFENVNIPKLPIPIVFELIYWFSDGDNLYRAQKEAVKEDGKVLSIEFISVFFGYCREAIVAYELEHGEYKEKNDDSKLTELEHEEKKEKDKESKLIEHSWRRRIYLNKLDPFEEVLKCILYVNNKKNI